MDKIKNKTVIFAIIITLILIGFIGCIYITSGGISKSKSEDIVETYFDLVNRKEYIEMYKLLSVASKEDISEEGFVLRNKNIYEGIEVENLVIDDLKIDINGKENIASFRCSMDTIAGQIVFNNTITPGSAFKPITAAIGLETNTLSPEEDKNISGLQWQKNECWGGYNITRVKDYGLAANLKKCFSIFR